MKQPARYEVGILYETYEGLNVPVGLLGAAEVITGWAGPNRASKAPPHPRYSMLP